MDVMGTTLNHNVPHETFPINASSGRELPLVSKTFSTVTTFNLL